MAADEEFAGNGFGAGQSNVPPNTSVSPTITTLTAPTPQSSLRIAPAYEIQILDSDLNLITKLLAPYPLDKSGTILKYSKELDDFGTCTFRISAYDTTLTQFGDIFVPHKNWIRVVRGGITVWQGAIIQTTRRTKDFIESVAAEPLWYLSKVLVQRSSNDPATGIADNIYRIFNSGGMDAAVTAIMNETIATFQTNDGGHALAGLTLGTIQNPNYPPNTTDGNNPAKALSGPWAFGNGTSAPQLQYDFQSILYIIKAFGIYTYADYEITDNLVFNFVTFKGNNLTDKVSFNWGGGNNEPSNIVDYNIPRFGQRMYNDLYGVATDPNGVVLHFDQTDSASISTYGLIQGVAAYTDIKDQATLNARVAAELPLISTPDDTAITVTLNEKGYPLGYYDVGDIVNINIQNKAVSFSDMRRIVGYTVLLNGTGREMTTVQTNKPLPGQVASLGSVA